MYLMKYAIIMNFRLLIKQRPASNQYVSKQCHNFFHNNYSQWIELKADHYQYATGSTYCVSHALIMKGKDLLKLVYYM